jgi:hypothetical protein
VNEVLLPGLQCGSNWSAVLVQVKGWQRSFQPWMKLPMALMRSRTLVKVPRRMAWRVMMPKKISTMLSQDPEVGMKCRVIRGCFASQACTSGCLWGGVVVNDDVQLGAGMGGSDLLQEPQELLVLVPRVARVGDPAGGHLEGSEQRGRSVPDIVVGRLLRQAGPDRQDRRGSVQGCTWDFSSTR